MSFIKRLFGGKTDRKSEIGAISDREAIDIVSSFGGFMEKYSPTPGCVADERNLPYPKEKIKDGIIHLLKSDRYTQMHEMLKAGYIQLAHWQASVGDTEKGLNLTGVNLNQDPNALAEVILKRSQSTEKWVLAVESEQNALIEELKDVGVW